MEPRSENPPDPVLERPAETEAGEAEPPSGPLKLALRVDRVSSGADTRKVTSTDSLPPLALVTLTVAE
jgi:hypothetical protein